jgi:hypothetical protein
MFAVARPVSSETAPPVSPPVFDKCAVKALSNQIESPRLRQVCAAPRGREARLFAGIRLFLRTIDEKALNGRDTPVKATKK